MRRGLGRLGWGRKQQALGEYCVPLALYTWLAVILRVKQKKYKETIPLLQMGNEVWGGEMFEPRS